MSAPVIRIEGLSKRYRVGGRAQQDRRLGEVLGTLVRAPFRSVRGRGSDETFWALKNVSFQVNRGEVLGIVGKNGAGKSTLLKVLSRITEPTEGRAELRGRVASLLEVGTGFHGELTGRENIYLNGTFLGMRKREIDRKFDAIVAFSEVDRFIDTPVKRYSSGMYVRLAFAVAAHLEPEILLVDEVLAVGDAEFQRKCLGKMNDIAQEGRTVLFVSHNMAAVQRLCSSAILLREGTVSFAGEAAAAVGEYLRGDGIGGGRYRATELTGRVQLLTARLHDGRGGALEHALSTAAFSFELTYVLPHRVPGIRIGVGLVSVEGVVIFTSSCRDAGVNAPSAPGHYRAQVVVPANTLVAGDYHLTVCLYNDGEVHDLHDPAASFRVEAGPSPFYMDRFRRHGLVHAHCNWAIESEAENPESFLEESPVARIHQL
jgi:lipopolysaccharide transport system ATP-binding protein